MLRVSSVGLVLKTRDYRDKDRWVSLLTSEYGKIDVLAKGVRTLQSKRRAALEPGTVAKVSWLERGDTWLLTEALAVENLLISQPSLERWRDFLGISEIVYHLALAGIEQSELYGAAVSLLRVVGRSEEYQRSWVREQLLAVAADQGVEVEPGMGAESVVEVLEAATGQRVHSFAFLRV